MRNVTGNVLCDFEVPSVQVMEQISTSTMLQDYVK
jgi:hypothetical protein